MATKKAAKDSKKPGSRRAPAGAAADPTKRGKGPKKGAVGAGRPSKHYREAAKQLLNVPGVRRALLRVLTDPENRNFAALYRHFDERANGREPMAVDARLAGTLRVVLRREVSVS